MASGSGAGEGYKPEFQEELKEPLVDLSWTDSTELWLIQWPKKHNPDFDGKEVVLNLHQDGKLASFQGSLGRDYDAVSFAAQEPNATVFLSSGSGTKIGNIRYDVILYLGNWEDFTAGFPDTLPRA